MSESRLRRRYLISWGDDKFVNDLGIEVFRTYTVEIAGELTYDAVVSAIVSKRYSDADVTAIFLNYMYRQNATMVKNAEYTEEYETLQAWRLEAKRVAAEAIAFSKERGWVE